MSVEDIKKIIMIFGITIILLSASIICQEKDIQNLEEKLNIYEQSYEEYCLEDSIRQVE